MYLDKEEREIYERKITIQESFYIMFFDLDKTKIINDNFGHLKGDKYIISTARIIKDYMGGNGIFDISHRITHF
jgi:diguanylate cyclase (GGDEF)-like protein